MLADGKEWSFLNDDRKKELELFITQGKAYEAFYRRVNQDGKYDDKLKLIRRKILKAQRDLRSLH